MSASGTGVTPGGGDEFPAQAALRITGRVIRKVLVLI
jgi:hypothetical protein